MKPEDKILLTRRGDTSPEAIALRARAAWKATQKTQRDLAKALGTSHTTINTQIVTGSPSVELMNLFYENFRIDFNFILYGAFSQLPGDVEASLLDALAAQGRAKNSPDS